MHSQNAITYETVSLQRGLVQTNVTATGTRGRIGFLVKLGVKDLPLQLGAVMSGGCGIGIGAPMSRPAKCPILHRQRSALSGILVSVLQRARVAHRDSLRDDKAQPANSYKLLRAFAIALSVAGNTEVILRKSRSRLVKTDHP
jgi:hypothetical protein